MPGAFPDPLGTIDNLLADREFMGQEWIDGMAQNKLLIRLRIQADVNVDGGNGKKIRAGHLFCPVQHLSVEICPASHKITR